MPEHDERLEDGILDVLDSGLFVLNADRRIVRWNAWLASASGVSEPRAANQRLEDLFPEIALNRLNLSITDALESGATSLITHSLNAVVLPLRTRTGTPLIHNLSIRAMRTGGAVQCVVQVFDVTAAYKRERVLRDRQNARYDAVVYSAPDAILTLDSEGVIQLANPAAALEFDLNPQDLIGQGLRGLFQDPAPWDETWRSVVGGEDQARRLQVQARRADGATSYLEASASHWRSDGRAFVTVILRNVNERHSAEAALRRLNETLEERVETALAERKLLADIVETTDAFIQVLDFDYRFLAVNKASADEFERVFGARPHVGDSLLELLAPYPVELANARGLWSRALAGEAFTTVQAFGDPGHARSHYELKFNALRNAAGQQIAAFQFVYDVTDRIERQAQLAATQDALRQSQKMEAIGQLTGGIAHDFNNLLTGIMGNMDILKRRIAAGRYEDTERFMDAAVTSANRAAALTHRLLAFARRQPLDPRPVDANPLVHGAEELLRRTLGEQIALQTDLEPDLWMTLSDPNQLENAILNLAINGRDAMPQGGRLTITTRNRSLAKPVRYGQEEVAPGDYAVVCVADTGTGMSPETAEKVFEPFFTTKPLGQGTGLGLSMIYGFAKQTQGYVGIETAIGEGTRVSLYLPRYDGDAVGANQNAQQDAPGGEGETVLLVEDDASVRLLIGEVLRELGYACVETIDAQTALPVITSNTRLDLMITDVGLPGLNGRQLAEMARQHRPDLKVLFVTGYAEHATGTAPFLDRGMEMVTKPFALDVLALKIREVIGSTT